MMNLSLLMLAGVTCGPQAVPPPTPQPTQRLAPTTQRPTPTARLPPNGVWHAWLDSPGGPLPFGLTFSQVAGKLRAVIHNPPEQIKVPVVRWSGARLTLGIDYYDAEITAIASRDRLRGMWSKRRGPKSYSRLVFHATRGPEPRFARPADSPKARAGTFAGRWAVQFAKDRQPSVGVFEEQPDGGLTGTFLTTLGDYRYLAGIRYGRTMRLSCFDGAHAFLFTGALTATGELRGDFWSADTWHETFTARRDPTAELPDAWQLTTAKPGILGSLRFPDLEGHLRSLDDPAFRGKARLIVVFGSWCPNCRDQTAYLVELDRRYRKRGLVILGLAFELTGAPDRDVRQLKIYASRQGIEYPLLLAGLADKAKASQALPLLDRVRSYPTTLFLDSAGKVRAVYSGFAGPGTGPAHADLRQRFESLIDELLAEKGG